MSATMKVIGWKAHGLRCPDHEVNCSYSTGEPAPITLIQMPNGTGKTTTLSLLRAALSGSADKESWPKDKIRTFQKRGNPEINGTFELRLLLNQNRVTILLKFDFSSGRVHYKTTRGDGQVEGFRPPVEFRRFMNEEFVKFYVFDGELADNILSNQHTDAQRAIESLFQLHLLPQMESKISMYWDDETRSRTAKDKTGYTRRTNLLNTWRTRFTNLGVERGKCKKELNGIESDLENQEQEYNTKIGKETNRAEEIEKANKKLSEIQEKVRNFSQGVLDSTRNPHAVSSIFAQSMYELKRGLDRVKLPESAAREFFEELAEENNCVCGRPIDDEIKIAIKERANQYLGTDDVSLLNSMKSSIDELVGLPIATNESSLTQDINTLGDLAEQESISQNELDYLKREAERSDPAVQKAKEEITRLEKRRDELIKSLQKYDSPDETIQFDKINSFDPERVYSIETIGKVIEILEEQVDEIRDTLNLREKRDLLAKITREAYSSARDRIASEIKDNTNQRITDLMPDNAIRVEKIDQCVTLENQSSGSAGENLTIGYAFLATLFNRTGEHKLPFVVDSPANPIDYGIRPKIGQLVPILTDQFIAFVISSEREKFLPALRKATDEEIIYITIFRKNITRYTKKATKIENHIETIDGIQTVDEKFFDEFQLDDEEE